MGMKKSRRALDGRTTSGTKLRTRYRGNDQLGKGRGSMLERGDMNVNAAGQEKEKNGVYIAA
jgi:hypothetical protein